MRTRELNWSCKAGVGDGIFWFERVTGELSDVPSESTCSEDVVLGVLVKTLNKEKANIQLE